MTESVCFKESSFKVTVSSIMSLCPSPNALLKVLLLSKGKWVFHRTDIYLGGKNYYDKSLVVGIHTKAPLHAKESRAKIND